MQVLEIVSYHIHNIGRLLQLREVCQYIKRRVDQLDCIKYFLKMAYGKTEILYRQYTKALPRIYCNNVGILIRTGPKIYLYHVGDEIVTGWGIVIETNPDEFKISWTGFLDSEEYYISVTEKEISSHMVRSITNRDKYYVPECNKFLLNGRKYEQRHYQIKDVAIGKYYNIGRILYMTDKCIFVKGKILIGPYYYKTTMYCLGAGKDYVAYERNQVIFIKRF